MKTDYKMTALKRPSDEQLAEIKQALIDKGMTSENTNINEIPEIIREFPLIKDLLEGRGTASRIFGYSSEITDASLYLRYNDTSNLEDLAELFYNCKKLINVPPLDTRNATIMYNMFYSCYLLPTIPKLDTRKVTNMSGMFRTCKAIHTIPELYMDKADNVSNMFDGCIALENLTLKNIPKALQIGSGTTYGHLLTLDSLINTCKECIKGSRSWTLTMGTANLEKIANVYVKFTDPSQTTIATGEKGDVVVCESTDEGAMTITEYMTLKKWTLA